MDKPHRYGVHTDSYFVKHSVNANLRERNEYMHFHYSFVFGFSSVPLQHTLGGREIRTDTPFFLYRAPFIMHSCNALDDQLYDRYIVNISTGEIGDFGGICDLGRLRGVIGYISPQEEGKMESLLPLLMRLHTAYTEREPKRVWMSLFTLLLYEVNRLLPPELPPDTPTLSYIYDVLQYIVENIGEDLRVETLAQKFFRSRNTLMQDFRRVTHATVHDYVRVIRTAYAKNLLIEDIPISVAAQKCGCSCVPAFIRMFREMEGMTPGQYRDSVQRGGVQPGWKWIDNSRG